MKILCLLDFFKTFYHQTVNIFKLSKTNYRVKRLHIRNVPLVDTVIVK